MKTLLISALFLFTGYGVKSEYVYICTGPKAKVYHATPKCKGLSKCSGDIKKVTLEEIQKSRRACKLCVK